MINPAPAMRIDGLEEVRFPVVVLGEALITSLRVERLSALDGQDRFASGQQRADVLDILTDARAGEPDSRRLDGVMVRFMRRDFHGASFGLALALADKRARYRSGSEPVVATGALPCGGRGEIAAIDGFEAKVRLVISTAAGSTHGGKPLIFVCPAANLDKATPDVRAQLAEAEKAGHIQVRTATKLEELADLWGDPDRNKPDKRLKRGWSIQLGAATAVLIAALVGGWLWLQGQPVRRCEDTLQQLDAVGLHASASDKLIVAAVEICGDAARRQPGNGRAAFLAAQAHMVNGGVRLASAYWRRAALLGDRDGLAAHGRDIWLNGPGTPAAIKEAIGFLSSAADKNSAAAMEDLAEIYRDGIGVPVDLAKAATWRNRAAQVRDESAK